VKLCIFGSRNLLPSIEEIDDEVAHIDTRYLDEAGQVRHGRVTQVVSGCASGADLAGERWAKERGVWIERFPADWNKHGKGAGPIRNRAMAVYADVGLAFWNGSSSGTANMVCTMVELNKPVRVVRL
jgi:hypothetical protein